MRDEKERSDKKVVIEMGKVRAADSGEKGISIPLPVGVSSGSREMVELVGEALTAEDVLAKVTNLLSEMGYRSLSVERSEDFTERIDVIFTRQTGVGEAGSSGYLRILTVCRVGDKVHVELYNFLSKFPADNMEMSEVKQALKKLFGKNRQIEIDVHE